MDSPRDEAQRMLRLPQVFHTRFPLCAVLIILSCFHLFGFGVIAALELADAEGIVLSDGVTPVGGDFINLWTVGQLLAEGRTDEVYDPAAFMSYQWEAAGTPTGFRLWAYPPHSLLLGRVFGEPGYLASWLLWSLLGLIVLWWGARRLGLSKTMSAVLLLSPAVMYCLFLGQSGNLAAGLLMAALAKRGPLDGVGAVSATALTIKPQLGFLLPVLWVLRGRWGQIALVSGLSLATITLSVGIYGPDVWRDYIGLTLPALSQFERESTGPFMYLIPSVFMAVRILTDDGSLAGWVHLPFALLALGYCAFRIAGSSGGTHRQALVLVGTAVIAPYLHAYDLVVVLAGAFLALPGRTEGWPVAGVTVEPWLERAILLAWALPYFTLLGNAAAVPIAPLVLLLVLVVTDRTLATRMR